MCKHSTIGFAVISLFASIVNSDAVPSPAPVLNPAQYASPSGKFVCEVDPSDLFGRGEGTYRITWNDKLVWQGAKPFTLYEAGITDDGTVAGYAYSHGLDGFSTNGPNGGMGEFHVVIMRFDGGLILDEVIKREQSRFLHARPNPVARGMLVDTAKDLFVVRLADPDLNRRVDILRGYRLSTGKETNVASAALESPTARSSFRLTNSVTDPKAPKLSSFPNQPLKLLGQFSFQDISASNPAAIRDVVCFDFDDQGRIGFVRAEPSPRYTFVLIGTGGELLAEVSMPIPAAALTNDSPKVAWVKEDRWVVTASDRGVSGKAFAWWLDSGTKDFKEIPDFASPPIRSLYGLRNGGFVGLATTRLQYSMVDELIAFDEAGKVGWRIKENSNNGPGSFLSPEDVTVTTKGTIAVLDNVRKRVQMFGESGGFLEVFDLEKLWGREPNYPTAIAADNAGGFVIKDFNGKPPLVWMDANGKVLRQFKPKHADGRVIDAVRGVRVSPTDRVWVCDGECFIRLADDVTADLVMGGAPRDSILGKVAALTTDQTGRLYAVDERNGVVHVFDETGRRLRVCKPDADDFSGKLILPKLSANASGEVLLSEGFPSREISFVHFGSDGSRVGLKQFEVNSVSQKLYPLSDGGQLMVGHHDAYLLGRDSKVRRTIQRRPDRSWLEYPDSAAVAPDGSFAVTTCRNYAKDLWQAHLYSASGDPIRTLELPPECGTFFFTYTGKHLVVGSGSEVYLLTNTGEPHLKFSAGADDLDAGYWKCFVTKAGRELWIASLQSKLVMRFELP
jgi:hypothetical protein